MMVVLSVLQPEWKLRFASVVFDEKGDCRINKVEASSLLLPPRVCSLLTSTSLHTQVGTVHNEAAPDDVNPTLQSVGHTTGQRLHTTTLVTPTSLMCAVCVVLMLLMVLQV